VIRNSLCNDDHNTAENFKQVECKTKTTDNKMKPSSYYTTTVLIASLLFLLLALTRHSSARKQVDICILSKCSDAKHFLDEIVYNFYSTARARGILTSDTQLQFNFIAQEPQPNEFTSMHGTSEVDGDLFELCTQYYLNYNATKFLQFLKCANSNMYSIPYNLRACLTRPELALSDDKQVSIGQCYNGNNRAMGKSLLRQSLNRCQNELLADWSPTMYITRASDNDDGSTIVVEKLCAWNTAQCSKLNTNIATLLNKL